MVNIKFSPQRLNDDLHNKLLYEEFNHKKILTSKYQDIPEFFIAAIDEYYLIDSYKKALELTIEAYKSFPEHFIIKRYYYYRNLEGDQDLDFEKFFAKEFDCIKHNTDYGRIVSDKEMRSIIDLISTYYYENGEDQKLTELYKKLECTQNPDLLLYVGVHILKEDVLNYDPYYYQLDEEVSDWLLELDLPDGADTIHFEPKNVIFYSLLNTALDYNELIDATSFDKLTNYEEIKHDIIWLIKQGVQRANLSNCVYNIDFFIYALYLTASHEVKELYTYFFKLFLNAGDDTRDLIFGDFSNVIVSPSLMKIFNGLKVEDFDPLFEDDESNWYIKSVYFNIIASLQVYNGPEHFTHRVIKKLFKFFDNTNNVEVLTWLINSIVDTNCKGFDLEIEKAFKEKKVDTSITGTLEELKSFESGDFLTPQINQFSDFLHHYNEKLNNDCHIRKDFKQEVKDFISQFEEDKSLFFDDGFEGLDFNVNNEDHDLEDDKIIPLWGNIETQKRTEPKIGRNDPCPCGSGKKYKKCCGA